MKSIHKLILSHMCVLVGGLTIGGLAGYFVAKDRYVKENREEIAALTKHYEEYYVLPTSAKVEEDYTEVPSEVPTSPTDGLLQKEVNTHKVDYSSFHNGVVEAQALARKVVEQAAPEEEEEEHSEETVYEISEGEYNQGVMPYKDIYFFTKDAGMMIMDWGDDQLVEEGREDLMQMEEDYILSSIRPFLQSIDFQHNPLDIIYVRNEDREEQYKIVKQYGSSLTENI